MAEVFIYFLRLARKTMLENIKQAISEDFMGWHVEDIEPKRTVVFTWVGIAKDWREYSDHMMKNFMKHDEDVRIKLWSK
jgi:hypothetical protein